MNDKTVLVTGSSTGICLPTKAGCCRHNARRLGCRGTWRDATCAVSRPDVTGAANIEQSIKTSIERLGQFDRLSITPGYRQYR
jgi:NADP-dependent 3-hydroxy acid dehydrogenase YdfG